jgi:hypothetical protein
MLTISSVSVSPWPQSTPTVKAQPVTVAKQSKAVSSENAGASLPVTPLGEAGKALATYAPSSLSPVTPTGEASNTTVLANPAVPERNGVTAVTGGMTSAVVSKPEPDDAEAQVGGANGVQEQAVDAAAEPTPQPDAAVLQAQAMAQPKEAYPGQLPEAYKAPDQVAMETQIKEFIPNLWKASRAAVDVLIGEEAKAAMAARAEDFDARLAAAADAAAEEATGSYAAQAADAHASAKPGSVLNTRV